MSESLTLNELTAAVAGSAAAFRSVTKLQPVGGVGDKVFPATYAGGAYATERRIVDGKVVDCILIDSVQAQSNRAEEALKTAVERGRTQLPLIEVNFQEANRLFRTTEIPNLTSLDVPHRLADAILRDSVLADGTRFSKSKYAQRWGRSTLWNATAVYELCPAALLLGMWGSPDKPGGLGAKFERAFVSEIVAVDVVRNNRERADGEESDNRKDLVDKRAGFRIDPLNASKNVLVKQNEDGSFQVGGKTRPSEINHGNIPFETPNCGIRFRYAEQVTVISLGALRKLHFPLDGKDDLHVNDAGRTVLAALGLCAGVLASEANTSLRSRCHLWPEEDREWELLERPGQPPRKFRLNGDQGIALLNGAVSAAENMGLKWMKEKLTLKPSAELVELVRQSQEAAAKEKGEGEAK